MRITVARGTRAVVLLTLLGMSLGSAGCIGRLFDFNLFIVGEQTALERQVLGNYAALGENLMIYSSVRGVDEEGNLRPPPPATESQQRAFDAMRNREYNRDDVLRLLRLSVIGERNDGLVEVRDGSITVPALSSDQIRTIIAEENADRQVLIDRLITTTPGGEEDQDEVRWIFARLNHDLAPSGAWLQDRAGRWSRK